MIAQGPWIQPIEVSVRILCGDEKSFDVFLFKENDVWVSYIINCDQYTQGSDIGDAINMAIDAIECIPPEHRDRRGPEGECSKHAFWALKKEIDQLKAKVSFLKERAVASFNDIENSKIERGQAVAWLRGHGCENIQSGWNVNFMVKLASMVSGKNEFDIMDEMAAQSKG